MSKVITLSRKFMQGHPKAGQPTHFVEKVLNSLLMANLPMFTDITPVEFLQSLSEDFFHPKHHTIRGGKRFKTGDKVSLRVWSDKPYRSPQITIAPDVELTVKDVEIRNMHLYIGGNFIGLLLQNQNPKVDALIINDGLNYADFRAWFEMPRQFSGQLLIWNNNNLPY